MDGGAWWAPVHGVTQSWTRLSDLTFNFQENIGENLHDINLNNKFMGMTQGYKQQKQN